MIVERIRGFGFVSALVVLAGLLAWMSNTYRVSVDATAQGRHTLSPASVAAINALDGKLAIDAWLESDSRTRLLIEQMVDRYKDHKRDIELRFIDPVSRPARARELSIHPGGELILSAGGRQQRLRSVTEKSLTYAVIRLAREESPLVKFVSGHLERQTDSAARHGYGQFVRHLRTVGFTVESTSLITEPRVSSETDLLVIAAPSGDYFPGEAASVINYLAAGGNLLWLLEPGQPTVPAELAAELGLSVLPGVVVDVAAQQLAVDTPDFAVIDRYPEHPALPDRLSITLFPQAAGLAFPAVIGWQLDPVLETSEKSWTETGQIAGQIRYDEDSDEHAGPITIGATFTRSADAREQRVAVIGDADFLANSWLGNGGNLYLGQQLFDWLGGHSAVPAIAPLRAKDMHLALSKRAIAGISIGYLVFLPGVFILLAFLTWRKRRA